jgi:hypothetical protein
MKWSVIIPTLWKSGRTARLIDELISSPDVGEVILIDNAPQLGVKIKPNSKLTVVSKGENIFVNPAWNWGIQISQYEHIALCNDDISFDARIFSELSQYNLKSTVVGCHSNNFHIYEQEKFQFGLVKGHHIGRGWGCLLFLRKSTYTPIPNELKIWCGDDWLIHTHKHVYSALWPIETEMSTSSSNPILHSVAQEDKEIFYRIISARMARRIRLIHSDLYGRFSLLIEIHYIFRTNIVHLKSNISRIWSCV